ncbi:hypothetical protein JCM19037_3233 [Geomicrobium sp. JCM 19037]|uniref:hypothetical protein n=1 Tax=Geomicrobium sp. JCM 19037 TaxID=1460634 RepID=UPI00045F1EAD|nr:hypothetical protein [Geomicrobium sp. JCM 19037]GAK04785.1 hypothetical protein JCM19037_3233 [Geomicrobium sp. JCM 19037]
MARQTFPLYMFGLLFGIGFCLHLFFNRHTYDPEYISSGLIFTGAVLVYYFPAVYVYHRHPIGKIIVMISWLIILAFSVYMIFFFAS